MTQIKTASWFAKLPADHVRIGISRGTPRGTGSGYFMYRALQPGTWFKSCATPQEYAERYFQILDRLDPEAVVDELTAVADGGIPTLLCFEPPPPNDKWCHRALVSVWLFHKLALEVVEYGHEGYGWQHPKLHPTLVPAGAERVASRAS